MPVESPGLTRTRGHQAPQLSHACRHHPSSPVTRVLVAGMQAVLALLSLYSSILFPVVIVATWMFALYAALSYAVPNKLCSSAVRNNAVRMSVLCGAWH